MIRLREPDPDFGVSYFFLLGFELHVGCRLCAQVLLIHFFQLHIAPRSIVSNLVSVDEVCEFTRGRSHDVSFEMTAAFAEELSDNVDGLGGVNLHVSLHGVQNRTNSIPQV